MSNIIRDRHSDLVRAFEFGLEQTARLLDEGVADGHFTEDDLPIATLVISFQFPKADLEICSIPEYDLSKPIPNPIPEPRGFVES